MLLTVHSSPLLLAPVRRKLRLQDTNPSRERHYHLFLLHQDALVLLHAPLRSLPNGPLRPAVVSPLPFELFRRETGYGSGIYASLAQWVLGGRKVGEGCGYSYSSLPLSSQGPRPTRRMRTSRRRKGSLQTPLTVGKPHIPSGPGLDPPEPRVGTLQMHWVIASGGFLEKREAVPRASCGKPPVMTSPRTR